MTHNACELAIYLATKLPAKGQSFDAYMQAALVRWPGLSDSEIQWARQRAAAIARCIERLLHEANELERYQRIMRDPSA